MVLRVGEEVWVKGEAAWVWEKATVEDVLGTNDDVVVKTQSGRTFATDLVFKANGNPEAGFADMTSMTYINEPTILSNLHRRSYADKPYTFMGPVMVAVNPLKAVIDPEVEVGKPSVSVKAHPFAVAETAYQQLKFGCAQARRNVQDDLAGPVSQTVVVGGESGAGKTESSKMVLRHLVARCGGGNSIDKRLLGTNPVLESFGNASTLRNPNSSRFGKLLKLHYGPSAKEIIGASVATYLLERSRVTSHEPGERGYHVFYQVIAGMSKSKDLNLSPKTVYAYLSPAGKQSKPAVRKSDEKHFKEMADAFGHNGIDAKGQELIYRVVAGVLHLGNMQFEDEDRPEGFVAKVKGDAPSQQALQDAVRCLGFTDGNELIKLFRERTITTRGQSITTYLDSRAAREARDAVARTLYSRLFNYIIERINDSLGGDATLSDDQPRIGVLDIFGFESFKHNDFEQLLINYTNESLQATFNEQIFHAEAELYKREHLVLDGEQDELSVPKGNSECMALLEGEGKTAGVLQTINQVGQLPQATDSKLNDTLHRTFGGNKNKSFGRVHPKDVDRVFIIVHYAGPVSYTVGSFLQKNVDTMPAEVDAVFQQSRHEMLPAIWACTGHESGGKGKKASIVTKFRGQIMELKDDLNATRCSFIRCIKPNALMKREGNEWFDRRYVTAQLKSLSVLQTAEVLKNGFPTRISYNDLSESYAAILPDEALNSWRGLGGGSETAFVAALFYAFGIPRSAYKLGLTRVFFKSGMLAELDGILSSASSWGNGDGGAEYEQVCSKFRSYFPRRRWRVALAKARAIVAFRKVMEGTIGRAKTATKLQAWYRMAKHRKSFRAKRGAGLVFQAMWRGRMGRRAFRKAYKQHTMQLQKEEREKREKLEAAEKARKEVEARKKKAEEERKERERDAEILQRKKREAATKKAMLKEREKEQFKSFKTQRERLEAKRAKQLLELEGASNFLAGIEDGSSDTKEMSDDHREFMNTLAEQAEEDQRLQEVNTQSEENTRELEAAKAREAELDEELRAAREAHEAAMAEHGSVGKRWQTAKRLLENKRARQLAELHGNNESASRSLDYYLERLQKDRLKANDQYLALHLIRSKREKKRPSQKNIPGLSTIEEGSDDEDEDDLGYNYGGKGRRSVLKPIKCSGKVIPPKQGFRLFRSWKAGTFELKPKDMQIKYWIGKKSGTFCLSDRSSAEPSVITANPATYKRAKVIEIRNGYMIEDQSTRNLNRRRKVLVLEFTYEKEFQSVYKMLGKLVGDESARKDISSVASALDPLRPGASINPTELGQGGRPISMEGKESLEDEGMEISEDRVELDGEEVSKDTVTKYIRRNKGLARMAKYTEEERRRIIESAVDKEDVEDEHEQMLPYHCPSCDKTSEISQDETTCPSCAAAIPTR